jgi:hypothetical protein
MTKRVVVLILILLTAAPAAAQQPVTVSGTVTVSASNLDVQIGGTDTVAANITQVSGATQSATNPLAVRLTDGSAFLASDTQAVFGGALTWTAGTTPTGGLGTWCRVSAAAPSTTGVIDDDVLIPWCSNVGAFRYEPVFGSTVAAAGSGTISGGVQRITIATDDPVNDALVKLDGAISGTEVQADIVGALPAGNNNIGDVDAVQSGTWTVQPGNTANTTAWLIKDVDPCSSVAKTYIPINISTATTTELTASLAGASTHYYICSINIGPVAGAQNIALVDDDTDNCASVTSGLAGGTTAGSGWNIAANGGLTFGNGSSSIARTGGTNRVLCAVTSAAVQTSGVMTVVAAP